MWGNLGDTSGQEFREWSVLWGDELRGLRTEEHSAGLALRTGRLPENPGQGPLRDRFWSLHTYVVCVYNIRTVGLSHNHLEMEQRFVYQTGPPPVVIAVGLKVDAGL